MHSLAFDLAARHTGVALLNPKHEVVYAAPLDVGSATKPPILRNHLKRLKSFMDELEYELPYGTDRLLVTIEDLNNRMVNASPALRLQGALEQTLMDRQYPQPVLVLPTVWQSHYKFKRGKEAPTSKAQAKELFASLGYETDLKGKAAVDIRDAVLIARWRQEKHYAAEEEGQPR